MVQSKLVVYQTSVNESSVGPYELGVQVRPESATSADPSPWIDARSFLGSDFEVVSSGTYRCVEYFIAAARQRPVAGRSTN